MKKLLYLLCGLLLVMPLQSVAEEDSNYSYWACYQVGTLESEVSLIMSSVFEGKVCEYSNTQQQVDTPWCGAEQVQRFVKGVNKKYNGQFTPLYLPYCRGFDNRRLAKRSVKKWEKRAKERKFRVEHIKISK